MRPSRRQFLLGGSAALVLAACGDDGESGAPSPSPSIDDGSIDDGGADSGDAELSNGLDGDLPPVEATDFEPLLGPPLEALGLVLTPRGGLIDTRNGQYTKSPNGNHVALYVEPVGDYTDDQFIDGILEVTLLSAPVIFDRWPLLESYDICQEPREEDDPRDEPLPATQIFMTREQVQAFDWDEVTIVDLLAGPLADPPTVERLSVSRALVATDRYQDLLDDARRQAGVF